MHRARSAVTSRSAQATSSSKLSFCKNKAPLAGRFFFALSRHPAVLGSQHPGPCRDTSCRRFPTIQPQDRRARWLLFVVMKQHYGRATCRRRSSARVAFDRIYIRELSTSIATSLVTPLFDHLPKLGSAPSLLLTSAEQKLTTGTFRWFDMPPVIICENHRG